MTYAAIIHDGGWAIVVFKDRTETFRFPLTEGNGWTLLHQLVGMMISLRKSNG